MLSQSADLRFQQRNIKKKPSRKVWRFPNSDFDSSVKLASELGISVFTARLLTNRGIKTAAEARAYLYPTFDELHDPFEFADMNKAVDRINKAMARGEKICIYGDYDADGTTATALLLNTFRQLDAPADYYIPDRFGDGYGLSKDTVEKIRQKQDPKLLITVDCGINAVEPVTLANELGIDVIVTDHHQPEAAQPPAYALISAKVPGNQYPYAELAGVGLAFKLAQGLVNGFGCIRDSCGYGTPHWGESNFEPFGVSRAEQARTSRYSRVMRSRRTQTRPTA